MGKMITGWRRCRGLETLLPVRAGKSHSCCLQLDSRGERKTVSPPNVALSLGIYGHYYVRSPIGSPNPTSCWGSHRDTDPQLALNRWGWGGANRVLCTPCSAMYKQGWPWTPDSLACHLQSAGILSVCHHTRLSFPFSEKESRIFISHNLC